MALVVVVVVVVAVVVVVVVLAVVTTTQTYNLSIGEVFFSRPTFFDMLRATHFN